MFTHSVDLVYAQSSVLFVVYSFHDLLTILYRFHSLHTALHHHIAAAMFICLEHPRVAAELCFVVGVKQGNVDLII